MDTEWIADIGAKVITDMPADRIKGVIETRPDIVELASCINGLIFGPTDIKPGDLDRLAGGRDKRSLGLGLLAVFLSDFLEERDKRALAERLGE